MTEHSDNRDKIPWYLQNLPSLPNQATEPTPIPPVPTSSIERNKMDEGNCKLQDVWFKEPELRICLMISRDTFRRWRAKGLPHIGKGRLRRYHWPTLLEWMQRYHV